MKDAENLAAAIADCRTAIQENPASSRLQVELGSCLQRIGNVEAAVQHYRLALAIDPGSYAAYNGLGTIFAGLRDWPTALAFFQAAVRLQPGVAEIHNNIANVYYEQDQPEPAIESYLKAIALRPETASYYNHLGNALRLNENYTGAEIAIQKAITLRPDYPEAFANLGFLRLEEENLEAAEACYREAIRLQPDYALAHTCLSRILLRRGDFATGWIEHEWRWQWKDFPSLQRNFPQPQWRGENIRAARLFLHAEQGFGDTIQFLRYVCLVAERLPHASIYLEVHPELFRLAATIPGISFLISRGDRIPKFDCHCPLMSLPLAFATTLKTIPKDTPYLQGEDACSAEEIPKLPDNKTNLRVGLAWAGSAINRVDRKRSLPLNALAPLFEIEGIAFYNLQRGPASAVTDASFPFTGHLPRTGDFATTAAMIAQLDLIISVDTSVAHLAGALNKPVWILLPRLADWRWLSDRDDSPWYPSVRLFRQENKGDWNSVIAEVAVALSSTAKAHRIPGTARP
jgi:tetratricopeptide (TPR) repeat protein